MNYQRRNLFLAAFVTIFFVAIMNVQAGDPAANNPIGKLLPIAVGFILLVFILGSLPYGIITIVAAKSFKKRNNKSPNFSFWALHLFGLVVWWIIWIWLFCLVWKK